MPNAHCMPQGHRSDARKTPVSYLKSIQAGSCKLGSAPAVVALVLRHVSAAVAHQQICPQSLSFCVLHHEHAGVIRPDMPVNALHKV